MVRPLAFITASWSDNAYEAKEEAAKYSRQIYDAGFSPICPKLIYNDFLKDSVPQEYKDKRDMALELLRRCRLVVVCGSETDEQVKTDIAMAKRYHIVTTTLDGIMTIEGKCKKKE